MSAEVRVGRTIRVPEAQARAVVTDPELLFECFSSTARFLKVDTMPDGQLWDVFLNVSSYEVGSRVEVRRTAPNELQWESVRGADNNARITVEPDRDDPAHSWVHVVLRFRLEGKLLARFAMAIAQPIVTRHVEAGLERLRHHLEYGD